MAIIKNNKVNNKNDCKIIKNWYKFKKLKFFL